MPKRAPLVSKAAMLLLAVCLLASPCAALAQAEAPLVLTPEERAAVEASKTQPITVGIIPSSAPTCYWDEQSGAYKGIFLDILDTIAKNTGLCFRYVELDLQAGPPIAQLKQGAPRLVAGILKTQKFIDDSALCLSDELLNDSLVLVSRPGHDFTRDPAHSVIAVSAGFQVALEYARETFPAHNIVEYPTIDDCLCAVRDGQADATLYMRVCMSYFLQDPHYEALELVPAYTRGVSTCAAGLASDAALLRVMDKGLAMLSEEERNGIVMNFTIMHPYELTPGDLAYKYRLPLAVAGILLAAVAGILTATSLYRHGSEKKLAEAYAKQSEAHARMKEALAAAEKASAAKGAFMSRMSHEIRTPLNAVIGYNVIAQGELAAAEHGADRAQTDRKVRDYLVKSELASKHLLTIINDVLDMSAIESGKINVANDRFDLGAILISLTALFYAQARGKNVTLDVRLDTLTEEWYMGDAMRVNQILTNLLSNAVKFTAPGGRVELRIAEAERQADTTRFRFVVKDTGIGMKPEYLLHIWDPFEQADQSISRRFGGTGLGLSITKNLVDIMGGTLKVESEYGVGSSFSVELTFARAPQNAAPREDAVPCEGAVLVASNDTEERAYLCALLEDCGLPCTVVSLSDPFPRGDYTFCLIDCTAAQPLTELAQKLRGASEPPPVLALLAYDLPDMADAAKAAGIRYARVKPLFRSALLGLIEEIDTQTVASIVPPYAAYDFGGARVLLAEDNTMNMEVAKRVLSTVNVTTVCAFNGREAVELFTASPAGTYSAILMDVQMPEMDGHEATRRIRACAHPDAARIPIIAMTADAFAENVAEALASGMNDHIAKPIDIKKLFAALKRYITVP